MQKLRSLSAGTDVDAVDNVLLYVSDSLRLDATPESVLDLGPSGRAIAASTFTGSGYPSILTGLYPNAHGVWSLTESLPQTPTLLTVRDGSMDAETVWRNVDDDASKPPLRMSHLTESTPLGDATPPFVHVVHDFGGHMMYGGEAERQKWDSIDEQVGALAHDRGKMRALYEQGVAESVERFHGLCDELRDRGLWDETLVVFTSDHAELLGEYAGIYGHGSPMVPGVLEVPLVFAGAGLDPDATLGGVTSTTDVVPTALGALGESVPRDLDGLDLWSRRNPSDRVVHSHVWRKTRFPGIEYRASSAWDANGGVVRHGGSLFSRLGYTCANNLFRRSHAKNVRRHMPSREFFRTTAARTVEYGDPVPGLLDEVVPPSSFTDDVDVREPEVSGPTREQLEELGYID